MRKMASGLLIVCALGLALPHVVYAQASAIAGVVKDTTGAVLPGVTVEATSPALIERVRSVTTDERGQYKIVDLRPGIYTVTFALPGFSTVKREGIELTAAFTAPVNADLRVGQIEETVTVLGASPVVDTQSVVRRAVVTKDTIDAMPTSKNWSTIGVMTVGVSSNQSDVGGTAGEHQNQLKAHGGSFNDRLIQLDGLMISNMACNYSCVGVSTNDASTQELSYEVGAISAETGGGGVRVNIIPKEGGNIFSGSAFVNFATHQWQANNLTNDLRQRGVTSTDTIDHLYDTSFAFGGPLKKDKLWFWTAHRYWGYKIFRTDAYYEINPLDFRYEPDLSHPGADSQPNISDDIRLTWQMTPKNKLSAYYNFAPRQTNLWNLSRTTQADAAQLQRVNPNHFETVTFRSTLSNRMLFEAGMGNLTEDWTREPNPESTTSLMYPVTEQTTGVNFRAYNGNYSHNITSVRSYRSSLSYVTGSHAFKFGFNMQEGPSRTNVWTTYDTALILRQAQPFQVTVRTTPYTNLERLVADLGVYGQDTWTLKRVTFNLGVRFDYLNNKVPAQDVQGGTWIGPRHFDEITSVPNWKDIGPRLGVAYDLFGNGKTAVKATLSRYLQTTTVGFARQVNPVLINNSTTRNWIADANGDGIPQASELGPPANNSFGTTITTTRFDPDLVTGWGKRRNNWEVSTSLTQELRPNVSAEVAYFRRAQGHFQVTDNKVVAPGDFETFCVTAPTDSRLPSNVSGTQICGLYDQTPASFARVPNVDSLVTFASNYGKQSEVFTGVDMSVNARIRRGLFVNGGVASGDIHANECAARVDNASQRVGGTTLDNFCDTHTGWLTQIKASGSYTLPWQDIQLGAVLQNLPGQPILAAWNFTSTEARPSLGRALTGASSRTLNLIEPGTMYTPRRTQVDLRLGKTFRLKDTRRLQTMVDIFNAFNSNAAVGATSQAGEPPPAINTTYSPTSTEWLKPFNILQGRYLKLGAQISF
ncbi:MAG: hypothetical protein AUH43_07910 [Acidobacteria bacterium 13_1_40CM_65_14]|nr:MAG: hypothetical protein AUH43_07910 [Acidobacteria bacterium 13_1_40CM_65_14]